jgi:two-component system chemotaxis sensor kinase CheA
LKTAQESGLVEFFAESDEILQRITELLTRIEKEALSPDDIDSLYRDVHTLKGSAQLFGYINIGIIAHALEASLEPVRQKKITLEPLTVDIIFKCLDIIGRIIEGSATNSESDKLYQKEMSLLLPRLVERVTSRFEASSILNHDHMPLDDSSASSTSLIADEVKLALVSGVPVPVVAPTIQETKVDTNIPTAPAKKAQMSQTQDEQNSSETNSIRVQVSLLDKLMNLVGEMVLTRNQVLQYARINEDNDFLKLTQRLDLVTTELQDNVMRTRMQPIGSVFLKFQRLVRDLSRDLGKNIELVITGADTELDKSLIEAIKDPLTHIVRNSCDHGIELPAVRKSNGKNEQGKLTLRAYHEGGQMIIEIQDDGGGLDPAKIKVKAIQKNVVTAEKAAHLTDKQIQELIFMPGFSTAEQVSSVSGRGVGMDVVRTNIEKIGGIVELESVAKQYMKIRLRIPLTLAIVPAMIVSCGKASYAIPQVKLQELLRVDLDEGGKIEKLQGQYIYRLRDQLLPLVFFEELLSGKKELNRRVFNIVVLASASHSYGLVVDKINDTADIVVKPLPNFLKKVDMFSGATIMGDGSVALIVDPQGISDRMLKNHKDSHPAKSDQQNRSAPMPATITEYLLVKIAQSTYAIPLVLVHRLEEFQTSTFDHSLEEVLVKYRDGLLPVLEVDKLLDLPSDKKLEDMPVRPVVVVSKNNRSYGLSVDHILDITQTDQEIVGHIRARDGLLGTVIAPTGEVLTVIDTYAVINKAMGISADGKTKAIRKVKVLLAEDTMFFVRQITKVLVEAGLEVTHAPNGEEALKILHSQDSSHFGIIISDIEMPKMNGFELAKKVREDERYAKVPLLALTTRFKELDQERGLSSGFDRYLEKLQSEQLIDTINSVLGGKK